MDLSQFATGLGFVILLTFSWIVFLPMNILGLAVVSFTAILVFFLQSRDRKRGTVVIDERREAVRNRSTRISWLLTVDLVGAAFIINYLGIVELSFEGMAVVVIGFMIGTQLFIETYYNYS